MRVVAATLALSLAACSFWYVRGPGGPAEYPDCTEGVAAPVGDGVLTVGAGAIAWLFARNVSDDFEENDREYSLLFAGIATVTVVSAVYGVVQIKRCRNARSKARDRGPFRGFPAQPPVTGDAPGSPTR